MTKTLTLVVCMTVLTWVTIMLASMIRSRGWTMAGLQLSLSNRESVPEADGLAGRAERAANNTKENFILFTALALVAAVASINTPRVELGAQIFVLARLVYVPVYLVGIPYLRTGVWAVGIAGMVMMLTALV